MLAIETFDDLLGELKRWDVQDDPKTGFVAARTFYEERNRHPWPMAPSREVGYVITWARNGGVFESENLKILSPYTNNLEGFVQKLSYETGDDLMVPNGKSAVSRLITALKKANHRQPGKRYTPEQIKAFRADIITIIEDNARVNNIKLAEKLKLPLSTFKRRGLNEFAARCRQAQNRGCHSAMRSKMPTPSGHADDDGTDNPYSDDDD
jgi:hypothetical protein